MILGEDMKIIATKADTVLTLILLILHSSKTKQVTFLVLGNTEWHLFFIFMEPTGQQIARVQNWEGV